MAKMIDQMSYVNDNIFLHESRLNSQYGVFLDSTPTFVTYFSIDSVNSTEDIGFINVENTIGKNSPIRFNKIERFPIYGIEEIQLDLSEEDQGLDSSYDGDGTIIPGTIKPKPDDIFIISYLNQNYLFTINNIQYDTIKSNNYYKISYHLRSSSQEEYEQLLSQVVDNYECIFNNIGTEDKCIIRTEDYRIISDLSLIYYKMTKRYMSLYYNKRYNSILYLFDGAKKIYDSFLTHFITSNSIFNEEVQYDTLYMSNEDDFHMFDVLYDDTIFKAIEERDMDLMNYDQFYLVDISNPNSIFKFYNDYNIKSVRFHSHEDETYTGIDYEYYLDMNMLTRVMSNDVEEDCDVLEEYLIKFMNDELTHPSTLNVKNISKFKMKYSRRDMIMVPIFLYIMNAVVRGFLKSKINNNELI